MDDDKCQIVPNVPNPTDRLPPLTALRKRLRLRNDMARCVLCEFVGTTFLIWAGTSANAQTVLSKGKQNEYLALAAGWALALTFATYLAWKTSGSHLNPAVSLFFFTFRQLTPNRLLLYWLAQFSGAFLGAFLTFIVYYDAIVHFDGGERFVSGPLRTAHIFATFPLPYLSLLGGLIDQVLGTAFFCFCVGLVTDHRNRLPSWVQPPLIGSALLLVGVAFGRNSGYAVNPARDFGPRFFALCAGYGWKIFSYRNHLWFWIPLVGPLVGGMLGAWTYQLCVGIHIPSEIEELEDEVRRIQSDKALALHDTVVIPNAQRSPLRSQKKVLISPMKDTPDS